MRSQGYKITHDSTAKPAPTEVKIPATIRAFIDEAAARGVQVSPHPDKPPQAGSGLWNVHVTRKNTEGKPFKTNIGTIGYFYRASDGKNHIRGIQAIRDHPLYQKSVPPPTKPVPAGNQKIKRGVGGPKRKHDWVEPGIQVQHKDGSIGKVVAYEPATQTMHVQWSSGRRGGTSGTTKAYHTAMVKGSEGIAAPKLTGREKALYGTKFPESPPRPKVEIKRPADPFAGIPGAHGDEPEIKRPTEPSHAKAVRDLGLEPITGAETHGQLVDKLTAHYRAVQMERNRLDGPKNIAAINTHHVSMGVPQVDAHQDLAASQKARVAAHVAEVHHRAPEGTPLPRVSIEDTSGVKGSNDLATSVAAYYNQNQHKIGVGQRFTVAASQWNVPGGYEQRGFFSRSGQTSFLQRSITHEYGHSLAMNLGQVKESKMLTEVAHALPGATPLQPMTSMRQWVKDNKAVIVNKIGTYASADERELAAELYTEFVHAAAPSPAAQVVGKYLEGRA